MALTHSLLKSSTEFAKKLIPYLNRTGSPFHSVEQLLRYLTDSNVNVINLRDSDLWKVENGKSYCVVDKNASFLVFHVGRNFKPEKGGLLLVATHTDSPCLKLENNCESSAHGFNQVNVTTYGGGLWHTWFDRDLGVAGKVVLRKNGRLEERLIHVPRPLVTIPSLAIHLKNGDERGSFTFSKEKHLKGIISTVLAPADKEATEGSDVNQTPLLSFVASTLECKSSDILDFDLCLMDSHPSTLSGINEEFLSSPRLDNLGSCFTSIAAFAEAIEGEDLDCIFGVVCYNYEEIGSHLAAGANSTITLNWLEKIMASLKSSMVETSNRSLVLSIDMAHAIHPNYHEKHIDGRSPKFHNGIVLKKHVSGNYGTNLKGAAIVREICKQNQIPLQEYRTSNEIRGGRSLGPFLSSLLCLEVVDIGVPQLAMHSVREICSVVDLLHMKNLVKAFINSAGLLDTYEVA